MNKAILAMGLVIGLTAFSYPKDSPSSGFQEAGISAFGTPEYRDESIDQGARWVEIKLSSAQVKTLNTTPILAVTSPGSGKALIPVGAYGFLDFQSAAWAFNSNNHIDIEYGGGQSGNIGISIGEDKLGEATADAITWTPAQEVAATANTALYVHTSGANPTVGDSPIWLRIYYRIVPSTLSLAQ